MRGDEKRGKTNSANWSPAACPTASVCVQLRLSNGATFQHRSNSDIRFRVVRLKIFGIKHQI